MQDSQENVRIIRFRASGMPWPRSGAHGICCIQREEEEMSLGTRRSRMESRSGFQLLALLSLGSGKWVGQRKVISQGSEQCAW